MVLDEKTRLRAAIQAKRILRLAPSGIDKYLEHTRKDLKTSSGDRAELNQLMIDLIEAGLEDRENGYDT